MWGNIYSQLSCNSCSRLTGIWELMKLSCKLTHANSRLSTLMQLFFSMQTLACQLSCNSCSRLTRTESWWNSHVNSRLSTLTQLFFSFDQDTRVDETLMQALACQLSCNSCSRLTRTRELMKLSCKLSLVNSHVTLVLVWPGPRVDETLMQTLACQLSCNSCSRLTNNLINQYSRIDPGNLPFPSPSQLSNHPSLHHSHSLRDVWLHFWENSEKCRPSSGDWGLWVHHQINTKVQNEAWKYVICDFSNFLERYWEVHYKVRDAHWGCQIKPPPLPE